MKKLSILIIFLASFITSFGQVKPPFIGRTNGSYTPVDPFLSVPFGLYIPKYCDTLTALRGLDTVGAIIFDKCNHILYMRDSLNATKFWRPIGPVSIVVGASGNDFNITGNGLNKVINIPSASSTKRGLLTSADWINFNNKLSNINGLVSAGSNVTVTGNGTVGSPYVISATGGGGPGGPVNARRSVTKGPSDSLQLLNDSIFVASGRKHQYVSDSDGVKRFSEDKYIVAKNHVELRKLRIPDTSYIFRLTTNGTIADYRYDPNDVSTVDDTVITIVTTAGYRYKRYIPDNTYDPKWWGAKANGVFDDTKALQGAINAIYKYTSPGGFGNGEGMSLRLFGNYRINPVQLVYPLSAVDVEVLIKGNVTVLSTWEIPVRWNLEGLGGPSSYGPFHEGLFASVVTGWINNTTTPQAAIALTKGAQSIRNLTINSHTGIGLKLDGTTHIPAALCTVENVFASCANYLLGEQSAILVADWFWARFIRCSVSVEQSPDPNKVGSAIKIVGETLGDANYTYLLQFDNIITEGRPIRIQSADNTVSANNVAIFNIVFRNCVLENIQYDSSAVIINSSNIAVSNVLFDMCSTADCPPSIYFLKNIGPATSGVTFNNSYDRLLYTGDPINGLVVNSAYITYPSYPRYFKDNVSSAGNYDGVNKNRAWKGPIDLIKFQGGQLAKTATGLLNYFGTTNMTGPFPGYNNDTIAIKIPPVAGQLRDVVFKQFNQPYHNGDKVFWGCWIKMDTVGLGTSLHGNFDFASKNYKFRETGSINFDETSYIQEEGHWQFIATIATIVSDTNNPVLMNVGIRIADDYDTTYISNPFVYFIDSSANVSNNDLVAWAKEHLGGTFGVPTGSYAIRNDAPFYIGDSTRFEKSTGKLQRNRNGSWVDEDTKVFTQTQIITISGVTTEQSLVGTLSGSNTLPANSLVQGQNYTLRLRGFYTTPSSNFASLNIRAKLGSTVIATTGDMFLGASKNGLTWEADLDFTVFTTGSSGTIMPNGTWKTEDDGLAKFNNGPTTTTINTTINQILTYTAQLGNADPGNNVIITNATLVRK
jgi:hypothetical protein